jgi:hypothetical protein
MFPETATPICERFSLYGIEDKAGAEFPISQARLLAAWTKSSSQTPILWMMPQT